MIGVSTETSEREVATEFFELCKTSWEFVQSGKQYDVVITTTGRPVNVRARVLLNFNGRPTRMEGASAQPLPPGSRLIHDARRIPIYDEAASFSDSDLEFLTEETNGAAALAVQQAGDETILHVGYNLFTEVRFLLTKGQPAANAAIPTLELHIALLRDLITRAGLPFVEIPPVPSGYAFIACLTHDVDHPILRNHRFDHTMAGFLYRSTIGTLVDVCRKRRSARDLLENWVAAGKLPFVHLGIAKDRWRNFDRYIEIESEMRSTFFVIPRRGYPGRRAEGMAPALRACQYSLEELTPQLKRILAGGHEVGMHGLDAWLDPQSGKEEAARLHTAIGPTDRGVRMHWLYFRETSPAALDHAGFAYDSSFGYNETVGYRAGTAQAYRPLGVSQLLELPLHVMDTALFYPSYLHLTEEEALQRVHQIVDEVAEFGGALTVNWHDRSIAPERLWEEFYRQLLHDLARRKAWCPTASHAVTWFRKRRAAGVTYRQLPDGAVTAQGRDPGSDGLPGLSIRIHQGCGKSSSEVLAKGPRARFVDLPLTNQSVVQLAANT